MRFELRADAGTRGNLTEPGKESPHRIRSVEENLDLFEKMKNGEFPEGSKTLRAKIDMASPNINLRDPVIYRILHKEHPKTGKQWKIYPSYDFAHGQSDSIEGITHSLARSNSNIIVPSMIGFAKTSAFITRNRSNSPV